MCITCSFLLSVVLGANKLQYWGVFSSGSYNCSFCYSYLNPGTDVIDL